MRIVISVVLRKTSKSQIYHKKRDPIIMTFVLSVLRLKYRNQIKFTNALSKCVSNDRPA